MAGTKEGAKKTVQTIKSRYPNHYETIGRAGGKVSRGGGFASNPELASIAGRKGGAASRRKPKHPVDKSWTVEQHEKYRETIKNRRQAELDKAWDEIEQTIVELNMPIKVPWYRRIFRRSEW